MVASQGKGGTSTNEKRLCEKPVAYGVTPRFQSAVISNLAFHSSNRRS
jgi:hypothetical protein